MFKKNNFLNPNKEKKAFKPKNIDIIVALLFSI